MGTVLGSASKSTDGGEGSLHRGVLAWWVGWVQGLQTLEIRVVRCFWVLSLGFPVGLLLLGAGRPQRGSQHLVLLQHGMWGGVPAR